MSTMSLPQSAPQINTNVLSFNRQPALARRVRSLMLNYTGGTISRATLNDHLADILPLGKWVDVGVYSVRLDGYIGNGLPVIAFSGSYSPSGTCPVCLCDRQGSYLAGEGLSVQLWCHSCGAIYESPEEVLR